MKLDTRKEYLVDSEFYDDYGQATTIDTYVRYVENHWVRYQVAYLDNDPSDIGEEHEIEITEEEAYKEVFGES